MLEINNIYFKHFGTQNNEKHIKNNSKWGWKIEWSLSYICIEDVIEDYGLLWPDLWVTIIDRPSTL